MYSEAIKRDGTSPAVRVWSQLQERVHLLESAVSFIEALNDDEAAASTLSARAIQLREVGVQLPSNINSVVCKRDLESFMHKNEFEKFFDFLDPNQAAAYPNGIKVIAAEVAEDADKEPMYYAFQVQAVVQATNNLLLSSAAEGPGSGSTKSGTCNETAAQEKMRADAMGKAVKRIASFVSAYEKSFFSAKVNACKEGTLRDDFQRLAILVKTTIQDKELTVEECDALTSHRAAVMKNRQGAFYRGLTLFPVGMHIAEVVLQKVNQCKKDQLLVPDLASAAQLAIDMKPWTADLLVKAKGNGEVEISVPNATKESISEALRVPIVCL